MTESVRLAKHLAEMLPCSRREAELYIEGGWVRVDGRPAEEPGLRIRAGQVVTLEPGARLEDIKPVTILLHKPAGYDADNDGPQPALALLQPENLAPGDRCGLRFLKKYQRGQTMATPLESAASGLIVFSQEHGIIRKLVDEAKLVEQEYIVEVQGKLASDGLALLNHGLYWKGKPLPPIKVSWQSETRLRFALKTPPPGLIDHMCYKVGLDIVAMKRIRIGRMPMAGLQPGQWRYRLGYERF